MSLQCCTHAVATVRSRQEKKVAGVARRCLWMEPERRLFLCSAPPVGWAAAQNLSSGVHSRLHRAVESVAYCASVPPLSLPGARRENLGRVCTNETAALGGLGTNDGKWQLAAGGRGPPARAAPANQPKRKTPKATSPPRSQPTHCSCPAGWRGHTANPRACPPGWIPIAL